MTIVTSESAGILVATQNGDAGDEVDTIATEVPVLDSFRWVAERNREGEFFLTGNTPTEGLQNFLRLRAGDQALDRTSVAGGAPERFARSAVASIRTLKELLSGRASYENGVWSLSGLAVDEDHRRQVLEEIRQDLGLNDWEINIALLSPFQLCTRIIDAFSREQAILFAPASAELTAQSSDVVQGLAEKLKNCPSAKIFVAGHTDADGPDEDNMTLSVRRAEAVVSTLIAAGVSDTRLYAIGYGETLPIASNETTAGKALNRRIVFELEE